ncbi:UNVERIFIED_CONTAM: hypothetical protein GTU68_045326 [Idotea baltica]|nr:hypothetical protein [Idotea baltica]
MPTKKTKKRITKASSNGAKKAGKRKKAKGGTKQAKAPSKVTGFLFAQLKYWLLRFCIVFAICLFAYTVYLDIKIREKFEGQKWALPAHVYSRPMELYLGQQLDVTLLREELDELGYRPRVNADRVGSYYFSGSKVHIYQRKFQFWDGLQNAQLTTLELEGGRISSITVAGQETEIIRLEGRLFGSVTSASHEDRALLTMEEVPQHLVDALIAIEDQQFYSHFGINPLGIIRALYTNLTAGRVVGGGSTLTQQLVKNYYLTSEQTIERKAKEAIMAVLLELHYSKDEILQTYINEIHLTQAGNRAIHGFGLGSQYFYGRPLHELDLPDLALLVGMLKGASYYNPIRNPERAKQRRNLVLAVMLEQEAISEQEYAQAIVADIDISPNAVRAAPLSYPTFMGFVRENLKDEYKQEDLSNDGLEIYTTLDPRIQKTLEQAVGEELNSIEQSRNIEANTLQVAATIIRTDNGEVVAMVGDREASFSGFNRAIDSRRPVGSLLKPFVYLTALEDPQTYSLASAVKDEAITVSQVGSADWQPQNYDGAEHGQVMLIDALTHSYNLATVQLGMELGVDNVIGTINRLGHERNIPELPSMLLGAVPMTVMDVGQLYLSLASGGFKAPIKGIRSVLSNQNEPLTRYSLNIEQVVEPEFAYLINYALQDVIRNGTGRSVLSQFQYDYGLAGKTGTTDDYRDSWFAGFSGNYLTVVWVGRDDNQSTGLSGASGAAKVWARAMRELPLQRLEMSDQGLITPYLARYTSGEAAYPCDASRQLPVLSSSLPLANPVCEETGQEDVGDLYMINPTTPETGVEPEKKKSFWQRLFNKD